MSYVRFAENSDVYVFDHVGGYLCCCACRLEGSYNKDWSSRNFEAQTAPEMVDHLLEHKENGHMVPGFAFEGLLWEEDRWESSVGHMDLLEAYLIGSKWLHVDWRDPARWRKGGEEDQVSVLIGPERNFITNRADDSAGWWQENEAIAYLRSIHFTD